MLTTYTDKEIFNWIQQLSYQHIPTAIDRLKSSVAQEVYLSNLSQKTKQKDTALEGQYAKHCIHKFCQMLEDSMTSTYVTGLFIKNDTILDKSSDFDSTYEIAEPVTPLTVSQELAHTSYVRGMNNLAFIDIETDGLHKETNHILQVAIVTPTASGLLKKWSSYIQPNSYSQDTVNPAEHINGITWKQLKDAPSTGTVLKTVSQMLQGKTVVGYNSNKFDIPFIQHHCQMHGIPLSIDCSLDLYPATWRSRQQKLKDALNLFDIVNWNPHDALGDTLPLVQLMNTLIGRGEIPDNSYELHDLTEVAWKNIPVLQVHPTDMGLITPPGSQQLKRQHSNEVDRDGSKRFR